MINHKLPDSFIRARRELLLDHPFFGSLIMYLKPTIDTEHPSVWVDGQHLGFNPEFFDKLDVRTAAGVLAHEILHCGLEHHLRREHRDEKLWNDAGDHAVNPIVTASGLPLPEGALKPEARFEGLGAEEIYALLEKEQDPKGGGGSSGRSKGQGGASAPPSGGKGQPTPGKAPGTPPSGAGAPAPGLPTGEVRDLPGGAGGAASPAERSNNKQEWQIKVQQAVNNAKGQGFYPAELEKYIEALLQPEIDWREELRKFFQSTARNESSWMRPNRRLIGQGLYLPGVKSEAAGPLVVVLDTSGSIWGSPRLLEQFTSELNTIIEDTKPEVVHVIHADAAVQKVEEFREDDLPLKLNVKGGGGTDFRPAFEWVAQQGITPDALVYLTDLMGDFPQHEPEYPVLWAATSKGTAPFGETIRLKEMF